MGGGRGRGCGDFGDSRGQKFVHWASSNTIISIIIITFSLILYWKYNVRSKREKEIKLIFRGYDYVENLKELTDKLLEIQTPKSTHFYNLRTNRKYNSKDIYHL